MRKPLFTFTLLENKNEMELHQLDFGPFTPSGHQKVQVSCVADEGGTAGSRGGWWYPLALGTFILLPPAVHTCLGKGIYMLPYPVNSF